MSEFTPIGFMHCSLKFHQEQPMQGNLSSSEGYIELIKGFNYEQGLKDLDGFERIWIIYNFHLNTTWRPLTNPPYNDGKGKKGVFATRSPYRPNQIGISCVKLKEIKGNRIFITDTDLLNGTPILDIKPYIPEYDSFPDAKTGWLENVKRENYIFSYSKNAQMKLKFLLKRGIDLYGVIQTQIGHNPYDKTRNKFKQVENGLLLRFKSWQILFELSNGNAFIKDINSGYENGNFDEILGNDTPDDIAVHKEFYLKLICGQ